MNFNNPLMNLVLNTGLTVNNHYGYYDRNGKWECYLNCVECAKEVEMFEEMIIDNNGEYEKNK